MLLLTTLPAALGFSTRPVIVAGYYEDENFLLTIQQAPATVGSGSSLKQLAQAARTAAELYSFEAAELSGLESQLAELGWTLAGFSAEARAELCRLEADCRAEQSYEADKLARRQQQEHEARYGARAGSFGNPELEQAARKPYVNRNPYQYQPLPAYQLAA